MVQSRIAGDGERHSAPQVELAPLPHHFRPNRLPLPRRDMPLRHSHIPNSASCSAPLKPALAGTSRQSPHAAELNLEIHSHKLDPFDATDWSDMTILFLALTVEPSATISSHRTSTRMS